MISASGGRGHGGCTPAGCWRGAESCAVLSPTKSNSWCCWEGCFASKELPSDCGSPGSQTHAQVSVQQGDVPQLKSTAKVFWDAHSNCWACFTLPYPCLTLPSSTAISVMFHMRPTRFMFPLFPCDICELSACLHKFVHNANPTYQLLAG